MVIDEYSNDDGHSYDDNDDADVDADNDNWYSAMIVSYNLWFMVRF